LNLDDRIRNPVDEKAVLIDRGQDAEHDAASLRERCPGFVRRHPAKSGFDQDGESREAIALRGWHDAVVVALEQRSTKGCLELVQLLAECGLTDIGAARG